MELPTCDSPVSVIHGDCIDVMRAMPAASVDMLLTDPPYGVGFDYGTDYDDATAGYQAVLDRIREGERVVKPGGVVMVYQAAVHARRWAEWFPRNFRLLAFPKTFVQAGRGELVPATDYALWWQVEGGELKPREWQSGMCRDWFLCNTQPQARDPLTRGHPCPRPLDGVRYAIRALCPPGGVVLDPFAGSGTTGVAAVCEGRRAVLLEREESFAALCRRRCRDAMGTGLLAGIA